MNTPAQDSRPAAPAAFSLGRRLWRLRSVAVLSGVLCAAQATAQVSGQVRLDEVASGAGTPVAITHAGDERLFITDRAGRVLILRSGTLESQPFLDISSRVRSGGEQGLLSIAFHPNYSSNGRFFANYTDSSGATVIARFEVSGNPDRANASSERKLLVIPQPFSNHNGGQLQFGPDGFLYIGMGDGGSANDPQCLAQDPSSLLGKMLRIDVDQNSGSAPFHGIPSDNPFVGSSAFPDEAWAVGLRNPWRFSFDRQTGDLFIGDVGQNEVEEIDFEAAGGAGGLNYGWKVMEGNRCFSTAACSNVPACNSAVLTDPIIEYSHNDGCSVTGGYVYRGTLASELSGLYIYGDFCSRTVWSAERQGNRWATQVVLESPGSITTFGEDRDGELYLATQGGRILRFDGSPAQGPTGTLQLTEGEITVLENVDTAVLTVERVGGSFGAASVDFGTVDRTAVAGSDFIETAGALSWDDGNADPQQFEISLIDDSTFETEEFFRVRLSNPTGSDLGLDAANVRIQDDDFASFTCIPDGQTLCLRNGRFQVRSTWRTSQGTTGDGQAASLTPDTGTFWFFDADNIEVLVKVLDACTAFDAHWVFAAGLTDVEVRFEVTDSQTGRSQVYSNELGQKFSPIQDVAAFPGCS